MLCPADCNIVRSRDPAVLDDCDVVIDVGGTYEPERNRFDHHQRGFTEVFGHGYNTKLSSAGMATAARTCSSSCETLRSCQQGVARGSKRWRKKNMLSLEHSVCSCQLQLDKQVIVQLRAIVALCMSKGTLVDSSCGVSMFCRSGIQASWA